MSQKNLRRKRQAATRAMPIETFRTRFQSSQLSQEKKISQDQNDTITTRYNKTYLRSPKTNVKRNVKEKQNQETKETESNKEFYPNKLKRSFHKKEIVLKPKPTYKLVGGLGTINKRKLRRPMKETIQEQNMINDKKDCKNIFKTKPIDLICLDDSDSLDEEDLMEILTCPSPVWWEDPPNEFYDEEPLSIKINEQNYNIKIKDQNVKYTNEEHKNIENNIQNKNQTTKNIALNNFKQQNNFIKRQNKLESLLSNIKSKKTKDMLENTNIKEINSSSALKQKKSTLECLDEDVLDDTVIKTLENIEIPIEDSQHKLPNDKIKEALQFSNTPAKVNTVTSSITIKSKDSNIKTVKGLTIKKIDIKLINPKPITKKVITIKKNLQSLEEINKTKMLFLKTWSEQCNMKVMRNNNKETEENHIQSNPSQTENKGSEVNINNINQNSIKRIKKRSRKKRSNQNASNVSKNMPQNKSNLICENPKADDQITVYKILSEEDIEDNKDTKIESKTYKAQLNSYYNQCKNINKCKKESDNKVMCDSDKLVCNNNQTVKSISVSNNETVKYCLQCSSIFDNDTCNYCAIKPNGDTKNLSSNIIMDAS